MNFNWNQFNLFHSLETYRKITKSYLLTILSNWSFSFFFIYLILFFPVLSLSYSLSSNSIIDPLLNALFMFLSLYVICLSQSHFTRMLQENIARKGKVNFSHLTIMPLLQKKKKKKYMIWIIISLISIWGEWMNKINFWIK